MNKIYLLLILFGISVSAQLKNIKIVDKENNSPLADSDIYFTQSTKNFISDENGKVRIDLQNISPNDELIISKKDYQNAVFKIAELKDDELIIQLSKVDEIELKETFITNLKTIDILQKVIENYEKNFNTEQHFYKVNFSVDEIVDSINRDFINLDLQLRFKKDNLSIKSKENVIERIVKEPNYGYNIRLSPILKDIHLKYKLEQYIKYYSTLESSSVKLTKYGNEYMYEFHLVNSVYHRFLIAKDSFAIVEFIIDGENLNFKKSDDFVNYVNTYYRYRPYQGKYILREFARNWSTNYKENDGSNHNVTSKINLEVQEFSNQPFPEFNQSVNEKMDIRKSFKN
ncbi:hypothetical protein [Faecalibacter rhinopitheci]|uniref:Carboxypeptidase-like regulatory domain-containing protein n=1 Tax=Faecalibacter rhinopitheci TaxID=2779678 RepID=A0A8J7KCZ5_9FLAO|nr:hypothetical protein [Faecalibacter rhinopitheci]MBF0596776.1 hypothetical protein [Faecalibacter rhinopitheci]